jgi:microcystin-dependent protein
MQTITITNDDRDLEIDGLRFMPVGSITCYAGDIAPTGWLLCDGAEKSQTTYSRLYSVLGSKYGAATSGHFKIPDLRSRFPLGKSVSRSLGDTGGNNTVTLSTANMPAHTHSVTVDSAGSHSHSINDPGHAHTQWTINDDYNGSGGNPPGFLGDSAGYKTWSNINSNTTGITVQSSGTHNHTATASSTGSGSAVDVTNPYIVLNYIIRY